MTSTKLTADWEKRLINMAEGKKLNEFLKDIRIFILEFNEQELQ